MKEEPGKVVRVVSSTRSAAQRFAFILLLGAAVGLLILGRNDPKNFEHVRMSLIDSMTPVFDVLSRPVATVAYLLQEVRELASLRQANVELKAENAKLLQWEHATRTLFVENDQLR